MLTISLIARCPKEKESARYVENGCVVMPAQEIESMHKCKESQLKIALTQNNIEKPYNIYIEIFISMKSLLGYTNARLYWILMDFVTPQDG